MTTKQAETSVNDELFSSIQEKVQAALSDGTIMFTESATKKNLDFSEGFENDVHSPEDALSYLKACAEFLGVQNFSFNAEFEDTGSNIANSYYITQLYEGIPVENGFFRVYTTKDGAVTQITGNYVAVSDVPTEPSITEKDAAKAAGLKKVTGAQLIISGEGTALAWRITVRDGSYAVVDAINGSVISRGSDIVS